jgi:DnaJ-domain-containing protein 1
VSLDWPSGWDRTPAGERTRNRNFQATVADTTAAIETEIERLDVDDWRASIANQHTKSTGLPLHNASPDDPGFVLRWVDDGEEFAVACDAYSRLRDNVRTVYLWVHETRMRGQRPVTTGDSEFAAARLPSGEDGDAIVGHEPPHEVLDVDPGASASTVRAAFRTAVKTAHPDQGGSEAQLKRVKRARDALLTDGGGRDG